MGQRNALMQPIRVGGVEIKNRILMPAMDTNYGDANGFVTTRMQAHYVERARGGVGLMVTEAISVSAPQGRISGGQIQLKDDRCISRFLYMTDSIHAFGTKVLAQLHHGGFKAKPEFNEGIPAVTASSEAGMGGRTLNVDEIHDIQNDYIHAAENAVKSGFDGIELHAAHGYLINQFYSSASNKRADEYGGTLENRFRFLKEIIQGIRKVVPPRFIVGMRLGAFETVEGGISLDDAVKIAKWSEELGVNMINLSSGHVSAPNHGTMSQWDDHSYRIDGAKKFKQALEIPVAVVGKFRDPMECSKIIEEGSSDFITIGRQLLCDPHWPNKVMMEKYDDIRPCLNCNEGCISRLITIEGDVRCVMNPYVGYDDRYNENNPMPAAEKKKIAVIGGGPSGMQFAITASKRGHDVTVFEKGERLGGQMHLAAMTPFKDDMKKAVKWFEHAVEKEDINVITGVSATADDLEKGGFEYAVIACGSIPNKPPIPGIERAIDFKSLLEAGEDNLPKDTSVTIIGGGTVGCEIAHLLLEKGCSVTVLEMMKDFCNGMESTHKYLLMNHLNESATMACGVNTDEITDNSVIYTDQQGEKREAAAQVVIYSTGQRSAGDELAKELTSRGIMPYKVGEAIQTPGNIRTSTRSALELAYSL